MIASRKSAEETWKTFQGNYSFEMNLATKKQKGEERRR